MWTQHLKNEGYQCITFNAWENDFVEDPLAALIGVINPQLLEAKPKAKKELGKLYEKTKDVGVHLLKRGIPVGLKIVTLGALDTDKEYEAVAAALSEQLGKDLIDNYQKQTDAVKDFKAALAEYASKYSNPLGDAKAKPLIFVIDELDRCKPSFAIELLERIKHFFSIPGIVFILAYDKTQLGSALKTVYGHELETDGYLRRFVDLEFMLPKPENKAFVRMLFNKYDLNGYFDKGTIAERATEKNLLINLFSKLFTIFDFSLRKQEQCFIQLSIAVHTTPHNFLLFPFLLSSMIVLKAADSSLYYKFTSKDISYKKILTFLSEQPGGKELLEDHTGAMLEAYLGMCNLDHHERRECISKYNAISENKDIEENERGHAGKVSALMFDILNTGNTDNLQYITNKLELLDRFHSFEVVDEKK